MRKMVPLSEAMETLQSFPEYLIEMVKVGEVSGNLDHVLHSLAEYYARDAELRRKCGAPWFIRSFFFDDVGHYCAVGGSGSTVFSEILASFGGTMPPFSQGLLSLATFVARHAIWLIPLIVIVVLGLVLWFRRSKIGRRLSDGARLKLPILGLLPAYLHLAFFHLLVLYAEQRHRPDSALMMTEAVMENTLVMSDCRLPGRNPERRRSFTALKATNLFPSLFVRMLALGNRTGEMDAVMGKIARTYENEVDIV